MLTKLAKALGLRHSNGSGAEQDLADLALKGKCAGDTYYYEMDQSTFDSAMNGDEGEAFYRFHVRQRTIGIQPFKNEVVDDLSILSGVELHTTAQHHNYDSGTWFLTQIVAQARCEFATALSIYWANQPTYFYERYETLDLACQNTGDLFHARAELLNQIERKTRLDAFAQNLPVPDVGCFVDDQPDYLVKPFTNIPVELRIYL
jgi:hypothetical protein